MAFQPYTLDRLLALWRALFPASYTVPIEEEAGGQGLDAFAQQAAQFARSADAAAVTTQAYYLRPHSTQVRPEAQGALPAFGTVALTRAAPAAGDIVLAKGTRLRGVERDSRGVETTVGEFTLVRTETLFAGTLGPYTVEVEAVRVGYQGNVPAGTITAFSPLGTASVACTVGPGNTLTDTGVPDVFTQNMVGRYVRLVGGLNGGAVPRRILSWTSTTPGVLTVTVDGPALAFPDTTTAEVVETGALGVSVTQPVALAGGRSGFLDAIAIDRGTSRQTGETDAQLRERLVNLADIFSPAAINRIAARLLDPLGIPWVLEETRDPLGLVGMVWDFHAFDYGTIANGVVFAPATRFFILRIGDTSAGEFGFAYDTPFLPIPPTSAGNAWDVGVYDGFPVDYYAAAAALWAAVEAARAAGIGWLLVRDPAL